MKHKLFTLLIAVMANLGTMFASDTQVNGIWYNFDSSTHTATVTYQGSSYNSYSGEYTGSVVIPASITYNNEEYSVISIGYRAFYNCKSLTSVTIPNSVTSIRGDAFSYCSSLSSVTIGNGVTNIGSNAFLECENLTSVRISDLAAWCTILFERTINQGENTQYANPLYYAGNLYLNNTLVDDLVIPNGVTEIGFQAFAYCTSITSVTISEGVTSLGKGAFLGCSNLSSIKLPTSLTNLGTYTFSGCTGLTSIEIPDGVTSIGEYTFNNCTNLTSVVIPNSVTHIGYEAFAYCRNLTSFTNHAATPQSMDTPCFTMVTLANATLYVPAESIALYNAYPNWAQFGTIKAIGDDSTSCVVASGTCGNRLTWELSCDSVLTISGTGAMTSYSSDTIVPWSSYRTSIASVVVGEGITRIANYSFQACENLRSVTLPTSVTEIRDFSFSGCTSLISIEIPNSVTRIRSNAFRDCDALTSIAIPYSVTNIQDQAFRGCNSLNSINVDSENPNYTSVDGVLFNKEATELIQYPAGKNNTSYSIPNSVTSIGAYAFYDCNNLTSVEIPNSVTLIGWGAFCGCEGLTSITVPNTVTSIGTTAFSYCYNLTTVTLPDSITSISMALFEYSNRLTSVIIPDGVTSIGYQAFLACSGLTSITIPNSVISIENYAFYGCRNLTTITNYAITPQTINTEVFSNFNKSTCTLYVPAESVEAYQTADVWKEFGNILPIEDEPAPCILASGTCGNRVTWELSCDSVLTISGTGAMAQGTPWSNYMSEIKSLIITNGVTSIGDGTFEHCDGLISIEIPNSVTSIGSRAFWSCSSLTSVTIPNSVTSIGASVFNWCDNLTSIIVENGNLVYDSRNNCNAIIEKVSNTLITGCKNTIIPNSVTAIGFQAFNGCRGLTFIEIPNSVVSIGNFAFSGCNGLTSVTIPNSVTSIGDYAFSRCSGLTSIEIPSSVTSIEGGAFYGCSRMTSINAAVDNPSYCSVEGVLFNKDITTLVQYPGGKRGAYTIPSSVTSIGDNAFLECQVLTSIEIPHSVTNIGYAAFCWCTQLSTITIPSSVTNIENEAFQTCRNLTSITNYATTPQAINANVFNGVNKSTCMLYVPAESIAAYQAADVWKEFGNILAIDSTEEAEILSIGEAIQIGMALDSMATSIEKYTIDGYVINAGAFNSGAKYQNWYMVDDLNTTSSDFQAYKCYPIDGIDTVEVRNGSKVRMTGHLQKYYDRLKGLYVVEMTYTPAIILSKPQIDTITVAEALALGAELEDNASTGKQYTIQGYVSSFSPYYEQFGYQNFYIADDPNSTANTNAAGGFYVFRGIPSTGTAVNKGDLVELTCAIRKYVPASGTNINIENSEFPISVTVLQTASDTCIVASGTCGAQGANLTWTLSCDSVLTISGTGAMADYEWNKAPWFSNAANIVSVEISEGITSVGQYAFSGCSSLTSVTIPNSITSIGAYAFSGCSGLISVAIPNSVTSIGWGAFLRCIGLTSIDVAADNTNYSSVEGVLFNKNQTSLLQYPSGKQSAYTIPNSVTSIRFWAFSGCTGLTSVVIPNSVTSIGSQAFEGCSGLTSVTNYATAPQVINVGVFDNVDKSTCTLYVPAESLETYQAAEVWKEFGNILPIEGDLPVGPTEGEFNVLYITQEGDSISSEAVMLHLPVAPEIAGFTFLKWQVVAGDLENGIIIQAVYQANEYTSAPEVYTNPANPAQKLIRNGNVYILTDDKIYSITGKTVK